MGPGEPTRGPVVDSGPPAAGPIAGAAAEPLGSGRGWRQVIVAMVDRAVVARVRDGRLRDVDWPRGLRAVVAVGCGLIAIACLISLGSGWLRAAGDLVVSSNLTSSVPAGLVWLVMVMIVTAMALGQGAALHAPWWLTAISTTICCLIIGQFGLRGSLAGSLLVPVVVGALIVALIVFTVLRARRRFVWWEFPVLLGGMGVAIALGAGDLARQARTYGFELVPELVQAAVVNLMVLVLPAAVAAGTAVAELTVGLTVAGAAAMERLRGRGWTWALLGVLVLARLVELGWRLTHLDPVRDGWLAFLPAAVVLVVLGLVVGLLLRIAARTAQPLVVSGFPEELGRIALPVGALLVGLILPLLVAATGYAIVVSIDPMGPLAKGDFDLGVLISEGTDAVRLGLAAALVVLAVRNARQARPARAVLLGSIAVTLAAVSMRALTGQRWPIRFDPDALNVLVGVGVLAVLGGYALRRRLTPRRAVAGSAMLMLSLLFAARQVLGDPVGELVGYSGVGLVIVGLIWDFVTGSGWANRDSRRFPRPTRVLLVLTNTGLLAVVVAYAALVRDAGGWYNPNSFAELGDLVLGTGLLAAAFAVVAQIFARDGRIR